MIQLYFISLFYIIEVIIINEINKNGEYIRKGVSKRSQNLKRGFVCATEKCNSPSTPDTMETIEWKDGRRVVELDTLAENLGKCTGEGYELLQDLRGTVSENRSGLGSLLWNRCKCGHLNKIATSKFQTVNTNGVVFARARTIMKIAKN